jgi:hypothetical protein
MPDATPDPVAAYLAEVRPDFTDGAAYPRRVMELHGPRLLAAVEAVLFEHKIEPLYAHADRGECGCPVPDADFSSVFDDAVYDGGHPEGQGPDGTGLVCSKKIVGHWCRGCADVAVEHGCFEVPKAYPSEKCPVRATISRALLGEEASDGH